MSDLCDDPTWIEHNGGVRPSTVPVHWLIEIRHRAGTTAIVVSGTVTWRHGTFINEIMGYAPEADIMAYRRVNDYKLNRAIEEWRLSK